jgi:hypothetical protein
VAAARNIKKIPANRLQATCHSFGWLVLERDRFKSITLYPYFGEQVGRF